MSRRPSFVRSQWFVVGEVGGEGRVETGEDWRGVEEAAARLFAAGAREAAVLLHRPVNILTPPESGAGESGGG